MAHPAIPPSVVSLWHRSDTPTTSIVVLGLFDGVHLGHRALLEAGKRLQTLRHHPVCVLTFEDDMGEVKPRERIEPQEARLARLLACGADRVFTLPFSKVRDLSPEEFIEAILEDRLHAHAVVVGEDFRFGKGGRGDVSLLQEKLLPRATEVIVVPPVKDALGLTVSSTRIRDAVGGGDMPLAHALLGRPYSLTAPVLHGKALGRTIGIPTINQVFPEGQILPKFGVYHVSCEIDHTEVHGICNVGVRPTVQGEGVTCETHLIDYTGDLYGKTVTTAFLSFIREETAFSSLEALAAQIQKDIEKILKI